MNTTDIEREGLAILTALDQANVPYTCASVSPQDARVTLRRPVPAGERGRVQSQGWLRGIEQVLAAQEVAIRLADDDRPAFLRRSTGPEAQVVIDLCPTPQDSEEDAR